MSIPHPVPYQGSKRRLAPFIASYLPACGDVDTWYEPFAGSAAMSLWAAVHLRPARIMLGDSLAPMASLWTQMIGTPDDTAYRYERTWIGQQDAARDTAPGDPAYFNMIRQRFNLHRDPVDLLYLLCRCVKNAVRFNAAGGFTQSADRRRLGTHPDRMRQAMHGASDLLRGHTTAVSGDWLDTVRDAMPADFIYLDPPYMGTSGGRDTRYAETMARERLISGLATLRARGLRFALSYDGTLGGREYGEPLPDSLGLRRVMLDAGRSSQSTLSGRAEVTMESLYLT